MLEIGSVRRERGLRRTFRWLSVVGRLERKSNRRMPPLPSPPVPFFSPTAGGVREVRVREVSSHPPAQHDERGGEARHRLRLCGVRRCGLGVEGCG